MKVHVSSKEVELSSLYRAFLVSFLLHYGHASSQTSSNRPDISITTSNGLIEGHRAPKRPDVTWYLGIPFAESPVGALRFVAAKAYRASSHYQAEYSLSVLATHDIMHSAISNS